MKNLFSVILIPKCAFYEKKFFCLNHFKNSKIIFVLEFEYNIRNLFLTFVSIEMLQNEIYPYALKQKININLKILVQLLINLRKFVYE